MNHPLSEVFGFPIDNMSLEAVRYRRNKLCPFNNKVPNCTKDKANDPLGVCSVYDESDLVITCPVRFREGWVIAEDSARFFFPPNATWTSLTEVRLNDRHGGSAGNIDVVLVAYDEKGRVVDFGALEIQAVYVSGNIRRPFEYYMERPQDRTNMDWRGRQNYPRPDYLSSSRKRLTPQLMFKGGILNAWGKKTAIAVSRPFYSTLPQFQEVDPSVADIAWFIYDLRHNTTSNRYELYKQNTVYTQFTDSLNRIARPAVGEQREFVERLQTKLDEILEDGNSSDTPTIEIEL